MVRPGMVVTGAVPPASLTEKMLRRPDVGLASTSRIPPLVLVRVMVAV